MIRDNLITPEMNKILSELERITHVLMVGNKHLKYAIKNNCDEKVRSYIEKKLKCYDAMKKELQEEAYLEYLKNNNYLNSNYNVCVEKLKDVYNTHYSNYKEPFEKMFVDGMCVDEKLNAELIKFSNSRYLKYRTIGKAYIDYHIAYLERLQMNNFSSLFMAINNQVDEYGNVLTDNKIDEVKVAPIGTIASINDYARFKNATLKKEIAKEGVNIVKLEKQVKKHLKDKNLYSQYMNARENYDNLVKQNQLMISLFESTEGATVRGKYSNGIYKADETPYITMMDNMSQIFGKLPEELLDIDVIRTDMLVTESELKDIINRTKCIAELIDETALLSQSLGKSVKYNLTDFKFSKSLVKKMNETYKNKVSEFAIVEKLNKNEKSENKLIEARRENAQRTQAIVDAYKNIIFATPIGEVYFDNGKIVNVASKEKLPLSCLDKYNFDEKRKVFTEKLSNGRRKTMPLSTVVKQCNLLSGNYFDANDKTKSNGKGLEK